MNLSAPNRMVWRYFNALRRQVRALDAVDDTDALKENVVVCIMLAVAVVETFVNVLFRVAVSEPAFSQNRPQVLKDIASRKSIDYKLKSWPRLVFGKNIDFQEPSAKAFAALKDRRNSLMHFTSTHETISVPGIDIAGLADTSVFDSLTKQDAVTAIEQAEGMILILLRLRGVPEDQLPATLHSWAGKVPGTHDL